MSGDAQPRKRKDKRKKRDDGRNEEFSDRSSLNDKEDSDEKTQDDEVPDDHHHHGPTAGIVSKIVFFLLFTGLICAVGTVFFQLKGSELADTPIKESRYVSILENFVDEHPPDDHDDHHAAHDEHSEHTEHEDDEDTDGEHGHDDETGDDDEKPTDDEASTQETEPQEDEVSRQERSAEINLEPSMPEVVSLPDEVTGTGDDDDDDETGDDDTAQDTEEPQADDSEPEQTDNNDDDEPSAAANTGDDISRQDDDITGNDDDDQSEVGEQHPKEEIPMLVDDANKKEYAKIIDDVMKQQTAQQESREGYPASGITNDYDFPIREDLDEAQMHIDTAPDKAQKMFSTILEKYPKSPRAVYGKSLAIDRLSELHRSNLLLEQSIHMYRDVLDLPNVPNDLYLLSGFRCVDRLRFRGFQNKALRVLQRMRERFPQRAEILNQIAVTYLLMSQNDNAKKVLQETLKLHPNNGFAKAHYGFILKTAERDYESAVKFMSEGIASEEPGTVDGRFFFHLGDAYTRLGKNDEALKVYELGVKRGLFLSAYQRSLYNINTLTARPWWTFEQTTYSEYLHSLEENWKAIRDEAIPLLQDVDQGYFPENEGLKKKGTWKQFEMFARGERIDLNCNRAPRTCDIITNMPEAAECKRGQVKFSILEPGTHVWPHTGPTNCRLRAHLGLVVPDGARIRVANETRKWEEGKVIVFDDSFEHEVWHDGDSYRLVLIVDFWHPELTLNQKQMLSAI